MVQRISILTDVTRGVAYLHEEKPPVIHHDINSCNILLDNYFCGKLSDFGFSIQLPKTHGNKTMITSATGLPGTNGYRPPEYMDSKYSILSDIYSLGVVDFTEDDRKDVEQFSRLADTKCEKLDPKVAEILLVLIVKRIPKRKPPASEVLQKLSSLMS